jgi:hypothetical protein
VTVCASSGGRASTKKSRAPRSRYGFRSSTHCSGRADEAAFVGPIVAGARARLGLGGAEHRDHHDLLADTRRAQANFHTSGETRANQGISSDEMLHGWRIAQDSVHERAHAIVGEHALGAGAMLAFLEAMLRWNDAGMRASAEAHRKAELRELTRLAEEQAALRRVARMVAHGSSPEQIFVKVAQEVGQLFGVQAATIHRYEHDEDTIVGSWGAAREAVVVRCPIIVNGRPCVRDDGAGGADPNGSGIIGLSDRVAALGGTLNVDSPPGAGTIVTAAVPTR